MTQYDHPPHPGYSSDRLKAAARMILDMPYWERAQIGAGMSLELARLPAPSEGFGHAVEKCMSAYLTMLTR